MKKQLGQKIKEVRKMRGYTQETLAEKINLETSSLSAIESGRAFPSMVTLEKLASVLEVEAKVFFEFNKPKTIDEMKSTIIKHLDILPDVLIENLYKMLKFYLPKE